MSTLELQLKQEEFMRDLGEARYEDRVLDLKESGGMSQAQPQLSLIKSSLDPMIDALDSWRDNIEVVGGNLKKSKFYQHLKDIPSSSLAYLTGKALFNNLTEKTDHTSFASICRKVGKLIELEYRMVRYHQRNPEHHKRCLEREIKNNSSEDSRKTILLKAAREVNADVPAWHEDIVLHVGSLLTNLFASLTGYVRVHKYMSKGKWQKTIVITPETLYWISTQHSLKNWIKPIYLPLLIKPQDRVKYNDPAYYHPMHKSKSWIKVQGNNNYLRSLRTFELDETRRAVNLLQGTRWSINGKILETMQQILKTGSGLGGIPQAEAYPLPPMPKGFKPFEATGLPVESKKGYDAFAQCDPQNVKRWKRAARNVYLANNARVSNLARVLQMTETASEYINYDEFYYAYEIDSRGRYYVVGGSLSPSGCEKSKALLQFAEGKPLGTHEASVGLAIHGANQYGFDKCSLEDMVSWAYDNNDKIISIALDPLGEHRDFWLEADKPWKFLAWCFEWFGFRKDGLDHVSHIAGLIDGTCNGLQVIYSIVRDEREASRVNLTPIPMGLPDRPSDIYAEVATVATENLRLFIIQSAIDSEFPDPRPLESEKKLEQWEYKKKRHYENIKYAKMWQEWDVLDRKMTKRIVMTIPYSSKRFSWTKFIEERFWEILGDSHIGCPFKDDEIPMASVCLAKFVGDAVVQELGSALEFQRWLGDCMKVFNKINKAISWTAPNGFRVLQSYNKRSSKTIQTKFGDKVYCVEKSQPNLKKQNPLEHNNAISPNIVHSYDASVMTKVINSLGDLGITDFAMNHDEFGAHMCHYTELGGTVRSVWVKIFDNNIPQKIYEEFKRQLPEEVQDDLPLPPPLGALDIHSIKASRYCFV